MESCIRNLIRLDHMLTVVCHDAGGAEIVSSYLLHNNIECCYVLDGPAKSIFKKKIGVETNYSLDEAVKTSDSIICGSSWKSDLEYQAIKLARLYGKHSVVYLDHWVNYIERLTRNGESCIPDEVWVGDNYAVTIAENIFKHTPVKFHENAYFIDIQKRIVAIEKKLVSLNDKPTILYVCEPVKEHALIQFGDERYLGYTEEDALEHFLSNISVIAKGVYRIILRPHPSETISKYDWVKEQYDLPIEFGGSLPLIEEICESDIVVGCESMAMVVGLIAHKQVVSSIPPKGRPCVLPHDEIRQLYTYM